MREARTRRFVYRAGPDMAAKKLAKRKARSSGHDAPARTRGRVRSEGASFPLPPRKGALPADYAGVLAELKQRVGSAQARAVLAVNRELVTLYWHVGRTIAERQAAAGWGSAVVERLAYDLRAAFPDLAGFSPRNLWRMRAFYEAWPSSTKLLPQAVAETGRRPEPGDLPQLVAETPWGHNIMLLEKLASPEDRLWYASQIRAHGWSRSFLQAQIAKKAHSRRGKAITNFTQALPAADAALAQQALKDPYNFDFLTVGEAAHERVTERNLIEHVREFLLELGAGFAFVGNQVKLVVGGKDYFIDLLFYHLRLRCYVVVELKATAFKPDHVGQINFYLSAADDLLKHADDKPSIGLLLCKSRDRLQVEYALRSLRKPIGVAEWKTKIVDKLPKELKGSLPTVEEIEAELAGEEST